MFRSRKSTCQLAAVRTVLVLFLALGLSLSALAQVVGGTMASGGEGDDPADSFAAATSIWS